MDGRTGRGQRHKRPLDPLPVHLQEGHPAADPVRVRTLILNDHEGAGDKAPILFAVLGRLMPGAGYHEASAQDARPRILAFFSTHLRPGTAGPGDGTRQENAGT